MSGYRARALPDVRDGLKIVQRRNLTDARNVRPRPIKRTRKPPLIVGTSWVSKSLRVSAIYVSIVLMTRFQLPQP
jgi:DNA gyrase/topoisomerase IV subunit A